VNVARRPGDDQVNAPLGQPRAVALVVPEGLGVNPVEAEEGGEEERGNEERFLQEFSATNFTNCHELEKYIRVNSCNSWQKSQGDS
jgi:hypothetical protein